MGILKKAAYADLFLEETKSLNELHGTWKKKGVFLIDWHGTIVEIPPHIVHVLCNFGSDC